MIRHLPCFLPMWRSLIFGIVCLTGVFNAGMAQDAVSEPASHEKNVKGVYVIPIHGPINRPTLYVVRRGIKEAIANGVDVIVIDINTPGGELGVTLEIMKMIDRFEGDTYVFINNEAVSAGAFISVICDKLYFTKDGQIGAAEVVTGTGQDVPESMKRKLQSYINAKVRVYTEEYRYRGEVMRAMTDPNFELTIDDKVFSKEGDLLSLTAKEAIAEYGDPPEKLLGEGIVDSVDDLLEREYGAGGYSIRTFEINWAEELAQVLQSIVPVLMGLGLLLLFIEFKTPSFGLIGGAGIALIVIVFASNYIAGLAGYEIVLLFIVGVGLVALELFILPGTIILGFLGLSLMIVSLVWSLADLWPTPGGGISVDWSRVIDSSLTVILSTLGAIAALALLWKFLPKRFLTSKLVNVEHSPSPVAATAGGGIRVDLASTLPPMGTRGIVATDMHPLGTVRIGNDFFEGMVAVGSIKKGTPVQVVGYKQFSLLVEEVEES